LQNPILVFDLDNTLILRDQAMLNCIENLFDIQLTFSQKMAIEEKDKKGHSDRMDFCKWLKPYLNLNQSVEFIWETIKTNIGYFVKLNQNAKGVLQQLQDDYELVLLTNGGTENQKRKINQTGLNQFFPTNRIFISEKIGCRKPDSAAFQMVQNQFPLANQFIMIGDHFEKDILGAKNFGWEAIYLNPLKDLNQILNELRHRYE